MSDKEQRFGLDQELDFDCNPGLACFTTCCADVTIFLNPYDVLRMSRAVDMDSTSFLKKYTMALRGSTPILPLVVLKMNGEGAKACQFVGENGCTIYDSRPWACRMFPLDVTEQMDFKYLDDVEKRCKGLGVGRKRTVKEYLDSQDVGSSIDMDRLYNEITNHPRISEMDVDNPKVAQMVYLALYDLDLFLKLIMDSSFLDRFDLDEERIKKIKTDREELYKFGIDWVKFGLFGEKTLQVKEGEDDDSGQG